MVWQPRFTPTRDAMERLLDACAALRSAGQARRRLFEYARSPTRICAAAARTRLGGYIRYSDMAMYPMWAHLEDAVREGTHRWKQTFGFDGPIFSHFFRTEESMREFLRGMHGYGMLTSPKVVAAFDLSRFRKLVDLGGAHRTPRDRGVRALSGDARRGVRSGRARRRSRASTWRNRPRGTGSKSSSATFSKTSCRPADLYAAGQNPARLDRKTKSTACCAGSMQRLPSGGGVLVAEKLLNDDGVGPVWANMQSLSMLVLTEGKERSVPEYAALLETAGFVQIGGRRTGAYLDALLALKP